MYETPDLDTDAFVRSHEIRIHDAEAFEGMRKAGRLVAEALERALMDGEANARSTAASEKPRDFAAMVKSYLSRSHRDSSNSGCAISALAAEVSLTLARVSQLIARAEQRLGTGA